MRSALAGLSALALAACAGTGDGPQPDLRAAEPPVPPAAVSTTASSSVITATALVWPKTPAKFQQSLMLEVGGKTRQAVAFLSLAGDVIEMQIFDPLGLPLGSVKWVNGGVDPDSAQRLPEPLTDRHILDDIVLAFWPVETLPTVLNPDLTLTSDNNSRSVRRGLQPLVTVTYSEPADPSELTITDHQHGYTLRILSTELS